MSLVLSNHDIDKRIDHRMWADKPLSTRHLNYASTDAYAHLFLYQMASCITKYQPDNFEFNLDLSPKYLNAALGPCVSVEVSEVVVM